MPSNRRIPKHEDETPLERYARLWLNRTGVDYDDGWRGAWHDLQQGGCASGTVSELIYYKDTVPFYKRHRRAIGELLAELLDDAGCTTSALFERAGWDESDPLANETTNQNILAWFGFEEAARRVVERFDEDA